MSHNSLLPHQYSLRSLFLLTLAIAIVMSCVQWSYVRRQRPGEVVKRHGGAVVYDFESGEGRSRPTPPIHWLRGFAGGDFYGEIVKIDFNWMPVSDRDLATLKGLTRLEELRIQSPQVTDAGVKCLSGLVQLRVLSLESTQVTDAGLEHLEGLTELRSLWLGHTPLTDAGLEHIERLKGLDELHLDNTQVSDAGLKRLTGLAQLHFLSLANTRVTDAGLPHLTGLTRLRSLLLDGARVTNAGMEHIERLTQLEDLSLTGTRVTDVALRHLKGLTRLRNFRLSDAPLTDAAIGVVKELTHLREFEVINDGQSRLASLMLDRDSMRADSLAFTRRYRQDLLTQSSELEEKSAQETSLARSVERLASLSPLACSWLNMGLCAARRERAAARDLEREGGCVVRRARLHGMRGGGLESHLDAKNGRWSMKYGAVVTSIPSTTNRGMSLHGPDRSWCRPLLPRSFPGHPWGLLEPPVALEEGATVGRERSDVPTGCVRSHWRGGWASWA